MSLNKDYRSLEDYWEAWWSNGKFDERHGVSDEIIDFFNNIFDEVYLKWNMN